VVQGKNRAIVMHSQTKIDDAAVMPGGFKASGVHCGVKPSAPDLALISSDSPCESAGTFTTNRAAAACVHFCRSRLEAESARAIVVNSGNANACTGASGMRDTETMAQLAADALGVRAAEVFVSSTGPIGVPLPMDLIQAGVRDAAQSLSPGGGLDAATAILTTDTRPKHATAEVFVDDVAIRVTGIAKGSGMIHPNMATMLCYLLTDAAVDKANLQALLEKSVQQSFNRISVDGDQSTNDTVLLLGNGSAGNATLHAGHPAWDRFAGAVDAITKDLALRIVRDGEGATKLVSVQVSGAATPGDADRVARSVANSLLVKTSWAGNDPNWGRVLCATGYAGVPVQLEKIDISYDAVPAVIGGESAGTPAATLRDVVEQDEFTVAIQLHIGPGEAVVYACDTTENYVRINAEE
jgi:glutamate N-acetyltransferase/amino-acid N-acetyltransferase